MRLLFLHGAVSIFDRLTFFSYMKSDHSHHFFEITTRILSAISLLGSLVMLFIDIFIERQGPEMNRHEILVIYIVFAQLVFFAFSAIYGAILAGFRGGLSLSHFSAWFLIVAISVFIGVYFYMAISS